MTKLLSYEDARSRVLAEGVRLEGETVPLAQAGRRVLSADVRAPIDLPRFDNSQVDGYGLGLPVEEDLCLIGEIAAGGSGEGLSVGRGEAVRLFTGSPIPAGVQAVVMQEDVELVADRIRIQTRVTEGENVRRRGEELRAGDSVLPVGTWITPAVLSVLASLGFSKVDVVRRPRVTVVETGDELREPGSDLAPGQIYAANGLALAAAAEALGAEATFLRLPDDATRLREGLAASLLRSDLVVTAGGVSVGDHDLVRPTLRGLGVEERFWRVAIRPGKPVFCGRSPGGPVVLGLPGNPVSALVTFRLFAQPLLLRMLGQSDELTVKVPLGVDVKLPEDRDDFVRAKIDGGHAVPLMRQGSHMGSGLAMADVLVRIPAGEGVLKAGTYVNAILLDRDCGGTVTLGS